MQSKNHQAGPGSSVNPVPPSTSQFELDNGVSGLFIDIPGSPAMAFEACFRAGDYLCPKDKPDLAHFLEHLVLMANEDYPTQQDFARAVQAYGGYTNAHTGSINVSYEFDAPDFDWFRTLGLLLTAISKPLFLPAEFDSEKSVVRQEHNGHIDSSERRASELAIRAMGYPTARADECLACLDLIGHDDVREYHRQTHTLSNLRFIIAGHLPPERRDSIKQKLTTLDMPRGDGLSKLPPLPFSGAGLVYESRSEVKTAGHCLGFANHGLVLTPEEEVAMKLLHNILLFGDDSWIYGRARRSGLIYSLFGYCGQIAGSTNFEFSGQLSPENLDPLVDIILAAIDRLLVGDLSERDVEYHKNHAVGSHQRRSLTPRFWIRYFRDDYFDRELILSTDYRSLVEAVDRNQIVSVGQKMFGSFDWTLGLLGNVPEEARNRIEAKFNRRKAGK